MPYYVPLGVRGLIMNLGTHFIGTLGGLRYRSSLRVRARRASSIPTPHFRLDSVRKAAPAENAARGREGS
ncbi:hypothetical protein EP7_001129 [Isosphaeraceae bacterium EP7]